jgi:site-specific recombinase XerD
MTTLLLNFPKLIDAFLLCCTTEGKSNQTLEFYSSHLRRLSLFLQQKYNIGNVNDISVNEVRGFIYYLQHEVNRYQGQPNIRVRGPLSPFSIHGYASVIKTFWSWLYREGYIENNPMTNLRLPKLPRKIIGTYSQTQIDTLLNSFNLKTSTGYFS